MTNLLLNKDPAGLQGTIRKHILPLTVAAVLIAYAVFMAGKMPPAATPHGIVVWLILLIAFPVVLCWFPAGVILFGWYSGNRAGAVLAGLLLFPLYCIAGIIVTFRDKEVFSPPAATVIFIAVLSAVCGLAGYCAAGRTKEYLAVSVLLTGLGLLFFMSGIN